jgi:hypothetical protein
VKRLPARDSIPYHHPDQPSLSADRYLYSERGNQHHQTLTVLVKDDQTPDSPASLQLPAAKSDLFLYEYHAGKIRTFEFPACSALPLAGLLVRVLTGFNQRQHLIRHDNDWKPFFNISSRRAKAGDRLFPFLAPRSSQQPPKYQTSRISMEHTINTVQASKGELDAVLMPCLPIAV